MHELGLNRQMPIKVLTRVRIQDCKYLGWSTILINTFVRPQDKPTPSKQFGEGLIHFLILLNH
jgi:hypothetical protein